MPRPTTPSFDGFIFKQLTGDTCDGTSPRCAASPAAGRRTEPAALPAARRDLLRRRAHWPSTTWRRIWNGMWGVDGQYDFVHAKFDDGEYVPRMPAASARRRHLLSRCRVGLPAPACCTPSLRMSSASTRRRPPATRCLDAELSYTTEVRAADGIAPRADHRPARREPARRRRAQLAHRSRRTRCCCPAPACGCSAIVKLN